VKREQSGWENSGWEKIVKERKKERKRKRESKVGENWKCHWWTIYGNKLSLFHLFCFMINFFKLHYLLLGWNFIFWRIIFEKKSSIASQIPLLLTLTSITAFHLKKGFLKFISINLHNLCYSKLYCFITLIYSFIHFHLKIYIKICIYTAPFGFF